MSRVLPILFNTEMVRANLDGRKSCTRRLVKPQPDEKHTYPLGFVTDSTEKKEVGCFGFGIDEYGGSIQYAKPPYQPGDILYVRETWKKAPNGYYYYEDWQRNGIVDITKWKSSIHMPKEAARIWLKVTDVRVERLHEISEDGAKAEGTIDNRGFIHSPDNEYDRIHTAREHFIEIWNSTIKKSDLDRYGWDANPWVWVIEFERREKPAESPYAWNDAIHKLTKGVERMAKAVLVMDMPECCADCQLADEDIDELYCTPADDYYDGANRTKDRASFCPLRELPEKIPEPKSGYESINRTLHREGWNDCLDRILGETPEKGVASKRGNPAG